MLGLIDPGDEIVIFEPFYENYGPDAILSGAVPRYVTLHEPDWSIDPDELRAAVGPRTRAIVVNSPHNPTGKVFSRDELELIASICLEHDLLAFTDDIYEHIVYTGAHIPLATIPGMADRTVSINSMSKTYSVTGWRVGWVIAAPDLSVGVRRAHDFLTVGAAAPLQEAATVAMAMPDSYYEALVAGYRERRDTLLPALAEAGFRLHEPDGAYYVMTDIAGLTSDDDVTFARRLIHDPGVAAVPGSSFFSRPELGRTKLRFAFPKRLETLRAASERLATARGDRDAGLSPAGPDPEFPWGAAQGSNRCDSARSSCVRVDRSRPRSRDARLMRNPGRSASEFPWHEQSGIPASGGRVDRRRPRTLFRNSRRGEHVTRLDRSSGRRSCVAAMVAAAEHAVMLAQPAIRDDPHSNSRDMSNPFGNERPIRRSARPSRRSR